MASILVAEDDRDIRVIVSHLLEAEGHQVQQLKDGDSVIDHLTWAPPDLLVLDIMMPGQDGYQVLDEMRAGGLAPNTKVLILTARNLETDRERSYALGASLHLTKPFDPDELIGSVRQILSMSTADLEIFRERQRDQARLLDQIETAFGS
jgi:CheY-like chemotaxis protein